MSAASVAPARCVGSRRKSLSAGESLEGKLKTSSTRRLPNSEGMLCVGMPSSFSVSTWWGWLTPALAMVTEWPSRWRMVRVKPRSAWLEVELGLGLGLGFGLGFGLGLGLGFGLGLGLGPG